MQTFLLSPLSRLPVLRLRSRLLSGPPRSPLLSRRVLPVFRISGLFEPPVRIPVAPARLPAPWSLIMPRLPSHIGLRSKVTPSPMFSPTQKILQPRPLVITRSTARARSPDRLTVLAMDIRLTLLPPRLLVTIPVRTLLDFKVCWVVKPSRWLLSSLHSA